MGLLVAMKIGIAQINTTVGDFSGNAEKIVAHCQSLERQGADIILTPELALTGYPPQDLLFKSGFVAGNLRVLADVHKHVGSAAWIVGCVNANMQGVGLPSYNAAAILEAGKPIRFVHKSLLPTYDVFDEARYFEPSRERTVVEIGGRLFGITICEDIWTGDYAPRGYYPCDPARELVTLGASAILNLSASPFHLGKPALRRKLICGLAARHNVPFVYCNAIGGNDQLVFDGYSLAATPEGKLWFSAPGFSEGNAVLDLETIGHDVLFRSSDSRQHSTDQSDIADLRDALVLGLGDYMAKCGFRSAVLGLSGGIDSAVTACLAVAALGRENVTGVMMPSPISSSHSLEDAQELAEDLGIATLHIPIGGALHAFQAQMQPTFAGRAEDTTEENMQARLRGLTLMSLSNKFGHILLTTGNKSELAVGYCTLYGDMCGGLAVISDVPKTLVYRLAAFLNLEAGRTVIPQRTIDKPPSAELRLDQTDQDSLPPYDILDEILRLYIEENLNHTAIAAHGFDKEVVQWVINRVDSNEYKREQAAPGLKVTGRAFGIGRRMPLAQRYEP